MHVSVRQTRQLLCSYAMAAWVALSAVLSVSAYDFCQPDHECCQVDTQSCCAPAVPAPSRHSDRSGADCSCNHGSQSQAARLSGTARNRTAEREERLNTEFAADLRNAGPHNPVLSRFAAQQPFSVSEIAVYRLTLRWRC
jgi:hypothetical protein